MNPITLGGVSLPPMLAWVDQYNWSPVVQTISRLLTGSQLIEEATLAAGRPITLASHNGYGRVAKVTLDTLIQTLTPGRSMTLDFPDSRGSGHTVTWIHGVGSTTPGQTPMIVPITATPVIDPPDLSVESDQAWFDIVLRLIEI
jgi:hypothetical protein